MEENFSDNATALFGTKGVQLVMDGAKVTGVIAQDGDGNYLKINAKNGVVLAGGGFGGNKEMMDDLLPDIKRLFTKDEDFFAPFGRDGSTIQMGVWAGGRLEGDISTMNFDSMAVPDYLPGPPVGGREWPALPERSLCRPGDQRLLHGTCKARQYHLHLRQHL